MHLFYVFILNEILITWITSSVDPMNTNMKLTITEKTLEIISMDIQINFFY